MSIKARPNLNGNTPEDFLAIANQLRLALDLVDVGLSRVQSEIMHGRNYPTTKHLSAPRDCDLTLLMKVQQASRQLRALQSFIMMAAVDE